jgi:hypothetical protein
MQRRGGATVSFAFAGRATTTEAVYGALARSAAPERFERVNAIDRVLHERNESFENVVRLAVAELTVELGSVRTRLDPRAPIVVFGDHGFRLARDGRGFVHGGASTLERLVPVIRLVPR